MGSTSRPNPEVSTYNGSMNREELVYWINAMDNFFEYEEMDDKKHVKFFVTRLRGHATLWWDGVQAKRLKRNKPKIKSWDIMVAKLREKLLPKHYQLYLFRQMQNLRQMLMTMRVHLGILQGQNKDQICRI